MKYIILQFIFIISICKISAVEPDEFCISYKHTRYKENSFLGLYTYSKEKIKEPVYCLGTKNLKEALSLFSCHCEDGLLDENIQFALEKNPESPMASNEDNIADIVNMGPPPKVKGGNLIRDAYPSIYQKLELGGRKVFYYICVPIKGMNKSKVFPGKRGAGKSISCVRA
ncbi:hypothetical protein N9N67_02865 [Bacteriovoracaceae bacterium]|nr:hypothetical protein [Bacteriovoracaceae bacterium]